MLRVSSTPSNDDPRVSSTAPLHSSVPPFSSMGTLRSHQETLNLSNSNSRARRVASSSSLGSRLNLRARGVASSAVGSRETLNRSLDSVSNLNSRARGVASLAVGSRETLNRSFDIVNSILNSHASAPVATPPQSPLPSELCGVPSTVHVA